MIGIRVSKEGKNVNTGSMKDLIFNSDLKTFKVEKQGVVTINVLADGTQEVITIEHGLGFSPAFMVGHEVYPDSFYNIDRALIPIPEFPTLHNPNIYVTSNKDNLKIRVNHPFSSGRAVTNRIYYMIFNIPLEEGA